MSAQPPTPNPVPVRWYQSQRFTALWQSVVLGFLMFALFGLSTGNWSAWKEVLAIPLLSNLILTLREWWSPNVIAPIAMLNKGNVKP